MHPPPVFASFTDAAGRPVNQDVVVLDEAARLGVVADGIGPPGTGEVAAGLAANTIANRLRAQAEVFDALLEADGPDARARAREAVERAFHDASDAVRDSALSSRDTGATCDALVVRGLLAVVGHVGPGRILLWRAGQVHALTEDHTVAVTRVNTGKWSVEEAAKNPDAGEVTRRMGAPAAPEVDTLVVECAPGDTLFLCTASVPGALPPGALEELLAERAGPELGGKVLARLRAGGETRDASGLAAHFETAPANAEVLSAINKAAALQNASIFAGLDYRELSDLIAFGEMQNFVAGSEIVREGAAGDALYVVVHGRLGVESHGQALAQMRPGDHFGEMGLVDDTPRSATVWAAEPCKLIKFRRDALFDLMRRQPMLGLKLSWSFLQAVCARLRSTNESLVQARQASGAKRGPYAR